MSKHNISFNVEVRERVGTGGAREARRQGFVPGVLYGGELAPVAINLKKAEVIKAIETGQFLNATATLIHNDRDRRQSTTTATYADPRTPTEFHSTNDVS